MLFGGIHFVEHAITDWHQLNKSAVFTRQINDILQKRIFSLAGVESLWN